MNANNWFGIGHVTKDPEVKNAGESKLSVFRLAINRSFKKGDKWVEKPTFIDCEAWGPLAQRVQNSIAKGTEVYVRGRLESDEWTHKESGEKRSKLKIYVLELQVGKNRKDAEGGSGGGDASESVDELPF